MTGPEHYREAERLLEGCMNPIGVLVIEDGVAEVIATAQVHATLALAAATALSVPAQSLANQQVYAEGDAWISAAGAPSAGWTCAECSEPMTGPGAYCSTRCRNAADTHHTPGEEGK